MKNFLIRRGAHCMVVLLLVAVAGCGHTPTDADVDDVARPGGGGSDPVVTTSVDVEDFEFTPPDIQVTGGAMVT